MSKTYDLLCMGRSTLDLFSNTPGLPFAEVTGFDTFVGGCPTNICVAARRLGLKAALFTGMGDDYVSSYLLRFLEKEGIETRYAVFKPGYHTNTVLVALQPPEQMQFVAYHSNNADLELSIEDVNTVPIADCRAFLFSGMGLLKDPSRSATQYAAEQARAAGATVLMDLDYRPRMWGDARLYGVTARLTLALVDIAVGTEEEVLAAAGQDDLDAAVQDLLARVGEAVVVKRGEAGCTVYTRTGTVSPVEPFPVTVQNFLGAGDAFAGMLAYGYLQGWGWQRTARYANAAGAMLVAQLGTANAMPTLAEVEAFIEANGGV